MAKKVYILKEKEYARMEALKYELGAMLHIGTTKSQDILDAVKMLQDELVSSNGRIIELSKPKTEQDAKFNFLIKLINPTLGLEESISDPLVITQRLKHLLQRMPYSRI